MISDAVVGHTLVDIVVADPTRRDLVERATRHDLVAATDAERGKETHYRDRVRICGSTHNSLHARASLYPSTGTTLPGDSIDCS